MGNTCHPSLAIAAFVSLLMLSLAFPSCPYATRQISLAAVTGEDSGGIYQLQVRLQPGTGSVYTATSPLTGISTQESEQQAVAYAFSGAGPSQKECDIFFSIKGEFGENKVDGPSAGAAMAAAVKAALTGKQIRNDVVMTGTISQDGRVGEVGGIIEKSIAASKDGARYILVPSPKLYEWFLLSSVSPDRKFEAIEVSTMAEAEKILFSNYSQEFQSSFSPKSQPLPKDLPNLPYDADTGRFSLVAKKVVDELEGSTSKFFSNKGDGGNAELEAYFQGEIAKYRALISLGYPFTAANSAFLLSIDAEYVKIGDSGLDIDGSFQSVYDCISKLEKPRMTRQNLGWAIGSDLRRIWAQSKFNQTAEGRADSEGYMTVRDLLFSDSWCRISKDLAAHADEIGGEEIDESSLAPLAERKLSEAGQMLSSSEIINYDAAWHLQNGIDANRTGDFGAAIYESTYALAMQGVANEEKANIASATEKLLTGARSSLWGKVYFGQGAYLYHDALEGGVAPSDAYGILKYSMELDSANEEIESDLGGATAQRSGFGQDKASLAGDGRHNGIVGAALLSILAVVSGCMLIRITASALRRG